MGAQTQKTWGPKQKGGAPGGSPKISRSSTQFSLLFSLSGGRRFCLSMPHHVACIETGCQVTSEQILGDPGTPSPRQPTNVGRRGLKNPSSEPSQLVEEMC